MKICELKKTLRRWAPKLIPRKVRYLVGTNYVVRRSRFIMQSRAFAKRESSLEYRSESTNVYHCCVQRTASQWLQKVLFDSRVYRYSGLAPYIYKMPYGYKLPFNIGYEPGDDAEAIFADPFPENTIVGPLYVTFDAYMAISKPEQHNAFFITRDPRDIVVSWYFQLKHSAVSEERFLRHRRLLNDMSRQDGIMYSIDQLQGLFRTLRSWIYVPEMGPNVLVLRFEDITGPDKFQVFKKLFSHCDICIPDNVLHQLLRDCSFETLSGRKQGDEQVGTHYRKGISGDWKNHFDSMVTAKFKQATGDLITELGYDW